MSDQGKIILMQDQVAEKLDEMADLSESWKKSRGNGRNPNSIRMAMLLLCEECIAITKIKK